MVGRNERRRLGAVSGGELRTGAGAWIDGLDQSGLANRHMHETARRVEEGRVGSAGERPPTTDLPGDGIEFDERPTVAGDVEPVRLMIDIDAMGAGRWHRPVLDLVELRQA